MPRKVKWIKRRDVILALRHEPILRRGAIFHGDMDAKCSVCAVGAVMRRESFEKFLRDFSTFSINSTAIDIFAEKGQDLITEEGEKTADVIKRNILSKNWLSALSVYFESGKSRKQCIEFVKKNFPVKFRFEAVI